MEASDLDRFDDFEQVTFRDEIGVEASNLSGSTSFIGADQHQWESGDLVDYDDILDRDERAVLISALHHLTVWANSTETADGNLWTVTEVSTSPSQQLEGGINNNASFEQRGGTPVRTDLGASPNDTIDLIGRPLSATGHAPFSDGASGVGGGGSEGYDEVAVSGASLPEQMRTFHPRDDLFHAGIIEVWNIDDAGVHVGLIGQHLYGVEER